jgi:NADPH2:quinone reductase
MKALVAAPKSPAQVEIREVAEPTPKADEALVEVKAVSLNRGESRALATAEDGGRPGWDLAGVVKTAAVDGTGPKAGARVVGLVREGAWAQRVAVPTRTMAQLPAAVSFEAASTLPVAGLTALRALALGGNLLGQRVLITGATGGVGVFAVQLARESGAHVSAVVSTAARGQGLQALGADEIVIGAESRPGRYDLILESVGGASLTASLGSLNPGGAVVLFGNSAGQPTTFDVGGFFRTGGVSLHGLFVFDEIQRRQSGVRDLSALASLVARKRLLPRIDLEVSWREAGRAIGALMDRRLTGKAVLRID